MPAEPLGPTNSLRLNAKGKRVCPSIVSPECQQTADSETGAFHGLVGENYDSRAVPVLVTVMVAKGTERAEVAVGETVPEKKLVAEIVMSRSRILQNSPGSSPVARAGTESGKKVEKRKRLEAFD